MNLQKNLGHWGLNSALCARTKLLDLQPERLVGLLIGAFNILYKARASSDKLTKVICSYPDKLKFSVTEIAENFFFRAKS